LLADRATCAGRDGRAGSGACEHEAFHTGGACEDERREDVAQGYPSDGARFPGARRFAVDLVRARVGR
jgi:hypothetical protein